MKLLPTQPIHDPQQRTEPEQYQPASGVVEHYIGGASRSIVLSNPFEDERRGAPGGSDAVSTRDPQKAIDAVLAAWQQATLRERDVLQHLLTEGAVRLVTEAEYGAVGGLVS